MAKIEAGTLCIVVRDTRTASLNGRTCTVTGHVSGPTADVCGDHVIECGGERYVTHRTCLRPILPPGSSVALPRRAGADLEVEAA